MSSAAVLHQGRRLFLALPRTPSHSLARSDASTCTRREPGTSTLPLLHQMDRETDENQQDTKFDVYERS